MHDERSDHPLELPLAQLERSIIDQFVRARGYESATLTLLPEDERKRLLREASIYASGRLVEVEARWHFLHELHPVTPWSH
jgi:hypothetical protein